ncbi:hypothetical protein GIB67_024285, partial [Kingdonia uniflora]
YDSSRAADSEEAEAVAVIRGMEAALGRGTERVMVLTDCRRLSVGVDKVEFEDNSESVTDEVVTEPVIVPVAKKEVKRVIPSNNHNVKVKDDNHGGEVIDKSRTTDTYFQKNDGGEAGGITQQIGATYIPSENIKERAKELKSDAKLQVPGLLVIDTPGHEQFGNLRSRGSGLCDIAILVVDIVHGLKPQTMESLNLLKTRKTEFIIALNKVDRLYGCKTCPNAPIVKAMQQQSKDVHNEFKIRLMQIVTEFKEQGLNTEFGEGIPDLLFLLAHWTQKTMPDKLTFSNEVKCTVLEVKHIEGLGTTIDVILVNGVLREKDQIVVCGENGPIVTTIRSLHTPHPMKELRIKGSYQDCKELKAAQGIRIIAQVGTPICIPSQDFINIGRITSIEINHNPVNVATKGNEVGIKITSTNFADQQSKFGRHAKIGDKLVSHITRESIDVLKAHYKTEISSAEWRLVQKLMKIFKIRSNLLTV